MIPIEVAEIAELIWPDWSDVDDAKSRNEILSAAWRIYNAGYRKTGADSHE